MFDDGDQQKQLGGHSTAKIVWSYNLFWLDSLLGSSGFKLQRDHLESS